MGIFNSIMGKYTGAMGAFNSLSGAAKYGLIGAGMGGVYGATLGRDPGQGRLGGFATGALGGGLLGAAGGRYGGRMYSSGLNAARFGGRSATGGLSRLGMGVAAAGRAGFRGAMSDARMAGSYIGRSSLATNTGFGRITGLFR